MSDLNKTTYLPEEMAEEIRALKKSITYTGMPVKGQAREHVVNFFDYDGTLVYQYSPEEFLSLSNMPENPSHDGLISQGWNWDLNEAKDYVSKYGDLDIGQMYVTDDGKTRMYLSVYNNQREFYVELRSKLTVKNKSVDEFIVEGLLADSDNMVPLPGGYPEWYVPGGSTTISGTCIATVGADGSITLNGTSGSVETSIDLFYKGLYSSAFQINSMNYENIVVLLQTYGAQNFSSEDFISINIHAHRPEYGADGFQKVPHDGVPFVISSESFFDKYDGYIYLEIVIPSNHTYSNFRFKPWIIGTDGMTSSEIDWGDGTGESWDNTNSGFSLFTHSYQEQGDYLVTINSFGYDILETQSTIRFSKDGRLSPTYIQKIEIGDRMNLAAGCYTPYNYWTYLYNLETVSVSETTQISIFFSDCRALKYLTIPKGTTILRMSTFVNNYSLRNVSLPNTITDIGPDVFGNCYCLERLTLPDTIESLGYATFSKCYSLNISGGLDLKKYVKSWSYHGYVDLEECKLSCEVFASCTQITHFNVPSTVEYIDEEAFKDCTRLQKVGLSSGLKRIGSYAFSGCANLYDIEIPNTVTAIGAGAFENCASLRQISIPNGVSILNDNIFRGCAELISIVLPNAITKIGAYAFRSCYQLEDITWPFGLTEIGAYAFYGRNRLNTIILGDKLRSIGTNAFYSCEMVRSIYFHSVIPPHVGIDSFKALPNDCIIYVPRGCLNLYIQGGSKHGDYPLSTKYTYLEFGDPIDFFAGMDDTCLVLIGNNISLSALNLSMNNNNIALDNDVLSLP